MLDGYLELAAALPAVPADVWLSVDLSHLALGTDAPAAAERLAAIARSLPAGRRVQVGAEEAAQRDAVMACVLRVAGRGSGRPARRDGAGQPRAVARRRGRAGRRAASTSGSSRAPTSSPPARSRYGEPTDVAFLRLGFRLAERGAAWSMATHDARLREALLLAHEPVTVEQLLGVRPESLPELHGRGVPTRVYLPYGPEWFRYWMRRVAESRGV